MHVAGDVPDQLAAMKDHGIDLAISQKENAGFTANRERRGVLR
jgi:hypothetical protein